jgi:hypothetical protein
MNPFISIPQTGKVHFTIRLGFLHCLDPLRPFDDLSKREMNLPKTVAFFLMSMFAMLKAMAVFVLGGLAVVIAGVIYQN